MNKKIIVTPLLALIALAGQGQTENNYPQTFDFKEGDGEGAFFIRNITIER